MDFITSEDIINVICIKKPKADQRNIFVKCSGVIFWKTIEHKELYVGWERCTAYEDLSTRKCVAGYAYDLSASNCRSLIMQLLIESVLL